MHKIRNIFAPWLILVAATLFCLAPPTSAQDALPEDTILVQPLGSTAAPLTTQTPEPQPKVALSDTIPKTMSSGLGYNVTFTVPTGFQPPYTIAFEGHGFRFRQSGTQARGRIYGYASKFNHQRTYRYTITDGRGQTDGAIGQVVVKPYYKRPKPPLKVTKTASLEPAAATAAAAGNGGDSKENECELARINTYKNSDILTKKYRELVQYLRDNNIKYYSKDDYYTSLIGPVMDGDIIKVKIRLNQPAKELPMSMYVFGLLNGTLGLPYCAGNPHSQTMGANGQSFGGHWLRGVLRSEQYVYAETSVGLTPPFHLRSEFRTFDTKVSDYIVVPDTSFDQSNAHLMDEFQNMIRYMTTGAFK